MVVPPSTPAPCRVLHVLDPLNPSVGACVCRLAADALAPGVEAKSTLDQDVLLIGGSSAERLARSCGLQTADRLSSVGGQPVLSTPAFRRYLKSAGPFDLIHTWSIATLTLSTIAAPAIPRILYLANPPATSQAAKWLRILLTNARRIHHAVTGSTPTPPTPSASPDSTVETPASASTERTATNCTVVALSEAVKRAWVETGGIDPTLIHVIRPGLSFNLINPAERAPLRARWQIQSDETFVVGVLAHDPALLDARRLSHLLLLSGLAGMETAFVIPSGARYTSAIDRMLGAAEVKMRFIIDQRLNEPWCCLSGCNAALILGADHHTSVGMNGMLPTMWAAAAGLTIIGEASYALSEIIEHGHSGFLVKPGDDRGLVRRLLEAAAKPQLTWPLRDAARSEAFSYFSRSRFVTDLARLYQQILQGADIDVPDLPSTGGLRFAGRG